MFVAIKLERTYSKLEYLQLLDTKAIIPVNHTIVVDIV